LVGQTCCGGHTAKRFACSSRFDFPVLETELQSLLRGAGHLRPSGNEVSSGTLLILSQTVL
jgi:hypothetical protein